MKILIKKKLNNFFSKVLSTSLRNHLFSEFDQYIELKQKSSVDSKIGQHLLLNQYRQQKIPRKIEDTSISVFSQDNEDGVLLQIFSIIGFKNKKFIEIGAGNGTLFSNCANFCVNFGFYGIFIESDEQKLNEGISYYKNCFSTYLYQPKFVREFVSKDNINSIIDKNFGSINLDLLSIDIDGNDYWVLKNLESVRPRVLVLEINPFFGKESVTIKYNPSFHLENINQKIYGMSAIAAIELCKQKGYQLVATNSKGFNLFFVDDQEASAFETINPNEIFQKQYFQDHSGGFTFNDDAFTRV